jgi:predicted amidophosphoribosyltransferase
VSWSQLVALAFPTTCAGCGVAGPAICARCRGCLLPPSIVAAPAGVDWWVAPFAYDGAVRRLIVGAKYRQARTGLDWLAAEVAAVVAHSDQPPLDVVTWVPAHPVRRRRRGFDQGRLLAIGVAARLGLPGRQLLRRVAGGPQTGSGRRVRAAGPVLQATAALTGRTVLVVDDVATTGASLAAAAQALRDAGARHVAAATGARTEFGVWQREADLPGSAGRSAQVTTGRNRHLR